MSTRTNIVLDDDLISQAMEKARVKTKKGAVEAALRAYVRKPDYSGLLALERSDVLADDYDPKALFTHPRYAESSAVYPVASEPKAVWADPAARPEEPKTSKP